MKTRDAIAEPWGTRTPYGPGNQWPPRVDMHLAEGVSADDVDRWVQSASILHSNGDAMDIAVKDDRIVGVRGRAEDRVNHGRLGPKDLFGWQANNSADRLSAGEGMPSGDFAADALGQRDVENTVPPSARQLKQRHQRAKPLERPH